MFAVPGWSVDAAKLKQQTESVQDGSKNQKSKKRKRGSNGPTVTPENVGNLWEQHFEGKNIKKNQEKGGKQAKKEKKKRKAGLDQNGDATARPPKSPNITNPGATKNNSNSTAQNGEKKHGKQHDYGMGPAEAPKSKLPTAPPPSTISSAPTSLPASSKLTPLQTSMRQKLTSARFRHLNETLYTKSSTHSLALFSESPEMFEEYHKGFRQQVAVWPENPVDTFLKIIHERGTIGMGGSKKKRKPGKQGQDTQQRVGVDPETGLTALPRTHGLCTIADLGCGDASLSSSLQPSLHLLNLQIQSFDLHAPSPLITKADIAALPLADASVDVAIFCLALMGTNWLEFIDEAWRVLRWKGELWVAEIKSRFGRVEKKRNASGPDNSVGKKRKNVKAGGKDEEARKREQDDEEKELAVEVDGAAKPAETDVSGFVEVLKRRGFVLSDGDGVRAVDLGNKMFVRMEFVKGATPVRGKSVPRAGEDHDGGKNGTWKKKPHLKFVEDTEEIDSEMEAKVLKPCVYKLR